MKTYWLIFIYKVRLYALSIFAPRGRYYIFSLKATRGRRVVLSILHRGADIKFLVLKECRGEGLYLAQ